MLIGRDHHTPRFSSIRIDCEKGVHEAIDHLVAAGHRRIGMLDHAGAPNPACAGTGSPAR